MKDNVTYSVVIEEFDSEKGGWGPYTADDVQVKMAAAYWKWMCFCFIFSPFRLFARLPSTDIFLKIRHNEQHYYNANVTVLIQPGVKDLFALARLLWFLR